MLSYGFLMLFIRMVSYLFDYLGSTLIFFQNVLPKYLVLFLTLSTKTGIDTNLYQVADIERRDID